MLGMVLSVFLRAVTCEKMTGRYGFEKVIISPDRAV